MRHVHLGLGNFFRAHQAWYTAHAPDADGWGIAAFTGRRRDVADALAVQDGLYTLVTRGPDGDRFEVVPTLSAVHAAADHDAYLARLADPAVAVLTLTVTEAGYRQGRDGGLDLADPEVATDVGSLRADHRGLVRTAPARIVAGLLARRAAGAGAITVVPCDNLPANGAVTRRVVADLGAAVDPELAAWAEDHVAYVSTVVDRITPRATPSDVAAVRRAGWDDTTPVVTEPYSDWVLAGRFAAGCPSWDAAGARFVDDATAFEQRKLWLLNGAHSLLAYAGLARGLTTIGEAAAEPVLVGWVREWWGLAGAHLPFPADETADYCDALLARFTNARIRHELAQVAADGTKKLPVRVLPVLRAERAAGRQAVAAIRILAAYVAALRSGDPLPSDPRADALRAAAALPSTRRTARAALQLLDPELAEDTELLGAVAALAEDVTRR